MKACIPFVLTEEQEQLRREIRDFAAREIAPNVMKWDEASEFPLDVVKKLGQMGLLGVIFPPEYERFRTGLCRLHARDRRIIRGRRLDRYHCCRAQFPLYEPHLHRRKRCAEEEVRLKLATGEWIGAWGLTEPGAGSDASNSRTTAMKKGDRYVLNGNKTFITNGHYADVAVVIASTDKSKGTHGLSAFVVEKGTKGFRAGQKRKQTRPACQ